MAQKSIGNLAIVIGANMGPLAADLARGEKQVKSAADKASGDFGGSILGGLKGLAPALAGIFAVGSVMAFGKALKDQIDELAQAARDAQKIGLSFDTFMNLRDLAESMGVDAGTLSKGFVTFQRRLVEARDQGMGSALTATAGEQGLALATKGAAAAFGDLGLNVQRLSSLSPEEAFIRTAEAINRIPDSADRMAAAFQIFGRGGISMLPLIHDVEAVGEALRDAKGTFDNMDAAKVIQASTAMWKLNDTLGDMWERLAIELAPAVTLLVQGFQSMLDQTGGFKELFKTIGIGALEAAKGFVSFGESVASVIDKLGGLKELYNKISYLNPALGGPLTYKWRNQAWNGLGGGENSRSALWAKVFQELNNQERKLIEVLNRPTSLGDDRERLGDDITRLILKLNDEGAAYGRSGTALEIWKLQQRGASEQMLLGVRALERERNILDGILGIPATGLEIFEAYDLKLDRIKSALLQGKIQTDAAAGAMAKLKQELDQTATARAWALFGEAMSPLDKFRRSLEELRQLRQRPGGISEEVFGKSLDKLAKDTFGLPENDLAKFHAQIKLLEEGLWEGVLSWGDYSLATANAINQLDKFSKVQAPEALTRGSQGAQKQIIQWLNKAAGTSSDPQKRIEGVLKRQQRIQERIQAAAERTAEGLFFQVSF